MPFSATLSAAELNAAFSTAIAANALGGKKDHSRHLFVPSLTAALALSARTYAFTPHTDEEIRVLFARGAADAASRVLTVALTVDNGDDRFLVEQTVSASVTSAAAATYDTRPTALDLRSTTGVRLRLLSGVRHRLTLSTDAGTWTNVVACLQVRSRRRRA